MNIRKLLFAAVLLPLSLSSCSKTAQLEERLSGVEEKVAALENVVGQMNSDIIAARKIMQGVMVVGMTEKENGYRLEFSDGTAIDVTFGAQAGGITPLIGVDSEGNWTYSLDGKTFQKIEGASPAAETEGNTPLVRVDGNGWWSASVDGGKNWTVLRDKDGNPMSALPGTASGTGSVFSDVRLTDDGAYIIFKLVGGIEVKSPVISDFYLTVKGYTEKMEVSAGDELSLEVESSNVSEAMISVPEGWAAKLSENSLEVSVPADGEEGEYGITVALVSPKGMNRIVKLVFTLKKPSAPVVEEGCKEWKDFASSSADNLLLDFSYAGYDHGESAPADGLSLGYKVYDVTDYGAVPNDGKSDRDAFIKACEAALGALSETADKSALRSGSVEKANAVIYFPEGEYILHTSDDDVTDASGKKVTQSIRLRAGNLVIKGAGMDKTTIVMQDPALPTNEKTLYSSPIMLELKHDSGLTDLTTVSGDAAKGTFSVTVASTSSLKAGDWVCLTLKNNDTELIAKELSPMTFESTFTDLSKNGVQVYDYHQIKSISGNTVTFVEPLMHEVEAKWGWKISKYPHYENVGVEDLTFKGNAKSPFKHHGSWQDDGAYKPVNIVRATNSWIRRVRFTSVSEGCSLISCANVSAYKIEFNGNRGHAAVRSQASSRVFIGACTDKASGYLIDDTSTYREGAGQYHAFGVSKQSLGAVLWRNVWGSDSCFESHATQPRATLIDCCEGGWMRFRQGGDQAQVPNHLADLTIWNFNSLTASSGEFIWWDYASVWWKFLPPVIVGFHGESVSFKQDEVVVDSSHGIPVEPESLYEAQLKLRLGSVPRWLNSLK